MHRLRASSHDFHSGCCERVPAFLVLYRHRRGAPHAQQNSAGRCCGCIGALTLAARRLQRRRKPPRPNRPSDPRRPCPRRKNRWFPTVNVANAIGWPAGGKPIAANGMAVNAFATGLDHPRSLYVLPNGDVLVAETNAPPKPDDEQGHQGLDHQTGHGPRRRRHAERQSHHAAARHRWRRHRRNQERFSRRAEFAVRHGAGRRRFLCRRFRRDPEISLS